MNALDATAIVSTQLTSKALARVGTSPVTLSQKPMSYLKRRPLKFQAPSTHTSSGGSSTSIAGGV